MGSFSEFLQNRVQTLTIDIFNLTPSTEQPFPSYIGILHEQKLKNAITISSEEIKKPSINQI